LLRSILIGLVAGQRAMTPLAVVAGAARDGKLPADAPLGTLLANPLIASGTVALAASEMAGDKMKTAPDRIVFVGLLARSLTAAFAGAALAPAKERKVAAGVAVAAAIASSYVGFSLRVRAMKRFGQTASGVVEDAIVLGSGYAVANLGKPAHAG
jgi:uncharacterized membrane protein